MFIHKIILGLIQSVILSIIYGLLTTSLIFAQGQLLQDEGFELSTPNGTFPDAGYWKNSDAGGGADASCTTTAAHNGNNGLWEYTGNETWAWWSGPYQEFPSSTGMVYQGKAWIRTPSDNEGGSWVDGSKASVRIVFLSSSRSVLSYNESPSITTIGSSWAVYSVTSDPAPSGTKYVRFICYIEKPQGISGISIANFDDCYFENIIVEPTITTQDADNISPNAATLQGSITTTGGENCDERGFEWGTSSGNYPNSWTESGSFGTGDFDYTITGLNPQTDTYFRAKAHNSAGWGYGSERQFSTTGTVATPTFDPSPGTYASTQDVSISCATPEATIHYTTDGSEPNESSDIYASPIPVSAATTLKARAYKSGWTPSDVAAGVYIIIEVPTVTTQSADSIGVSVAILHGSIANSGGENCDERGFEWGTSSGSYPNSWTETGSFGTGDFTHKITGLNPETTYYVKAKVHNSAGWGYGSEKQFTTSGTVATPIFSPPEGTYLSVQDVSISCATPEAIIHYTTDGSEPTESDLIYSSPINITSTITLKARAYKSGWNASSVASGFYMIIHSNSVSEAAYSLLNERITENRRHFYVYQDGDSGFNHGFPSGFFADKTSTLEKIDLDAFCIDDYNSTNGCSTDPTRLDCERSTILRISFDSLLPGEFAGVNIEEPENFVERPGSFGYDLRGATHVAFEVRSPTPGGIGVQFGVGDKTTDFIHITQSSNYTTMSIPLTSLNLSESDLADVHILFTVVTNDNNAPNGGTVLLDNIRFEPVPTSQQTALSFPLSTETCGVVPLQTPDPGRVLIPSDQVLSNPTTTYESALTLLSLLERNTQEDLDNAKLIADAFLYALDHDNHGLPLPTTPDGSVGLHNAYMSGDIALFNDQGVGAGQKGDVRFSGFSASPELCGPTGFCLVLDGATGGNNAFAILALALAHQKTNDDRYLEGAKEIGHWIVSNLTDTTGTGFGGYYLGYPDEGKPKELQKGKSTENNADIFAAFRLLAEIEKERNNSNEAEFWIMQANIAGDFLMEMFNSTNGSLYAGTVPVSTPEGAGIDPSGPQRGDDVINVFDFLDSNTFTTLAVATSPRYRNRIDWRRPVQFVLDNFAQVITVGGQEFQGFNIVQNPTAGPNGIAWEFTAQAVVAMRLVDRIYKETRFEESARFYLNQIEQAQISAPFGDGRGLVASTMQDGDVLPPLEQCLSTPFQCIPERVGLAATNWAIYADLNFNSLSLVNASPLAFDDTVTTAEDTAVTINVLTNDTDPDGDALTVTRITQGTNGTVVIDPGDATVTYTPNTNYNGTDMFDYTISDGEGGSDTATVLVTITLVNDPPGQYTRLYPQDNSVVKRDSVGFRWTAALDVDSDTIKYMLTIKVEKLDSTFTVKDTTLLIDFTKFDLSNDQLPVTWSLLAFDSSDTTQPTDGGGNFTLDFPTGIDDPIVDAFPKEYALLQNYPNPFNPETTIEYQLPKPTQVKIVIHNLLGQSVATLVDEVQRAGIYSVQWNGKDDSGSNVASGIYLYRLEAGEFVLVKKLALLR